MIHVKFWMARFILSKGLYIYCISKDVRQQHGLSGGGPLLSACKLLSFLYMDSAMFYFQRY